MSPASFLILGLVLGVLNRDDRCSDLGLGTWTVVWFAGALFYLVPIALFVAPANYLIAGIAVGCLLGIFLGYALARRALNLLTAPWFR